MKLSILFGLQQIGQLRNETRDRELQLKKKEAFYDTEVANNQDIEKKISLAERSNAKLKQELQDAERLRDTFNSEVSTLPITTNSTVYNQKLHFGSMKVIGMSI